MSYLNQKLQERQHELLSKYGNMTIVLAKTYNKYTDLLDMDIWWNEQELKHRNKGSIINNANFNEEDWDKLVKYGKEAFLPCVKSDKLLNIEEFLLDILIHVLEKNKSGRMEDIMAKMDEFVRRGR